MLPQLVPRMAGIARPSQLWWTNVEAWPDMPPDNSRALIMPQHATRIGLEHVTRFPHVTSVVFSEFIRYVGQAAFSRRYNPETLDGGLKKVSISGKHFVSFGDASFRNCRRLVKVMIHGAPMDDPDKIDTSPCWIGIGSFSGCDRLTTFRVNAHDGMHVLCRSHAFENCEELIDVPFHLIRTIGRHAFRNCKKLPTIINLPHAMHVHPEAFEGTPVKTIHAPDHVVMVYHRNKYASMAELPPNLRGTPDNMSFAKWRMISSFYGRWNSRQCPGPIRRELMFMLGCISQRYRNAQLKEHHTNGTPLRGLIDLFIWEHVLTFVEGVPTFPAQLHATNVLY